MKILRFASTLGGAAALFVYGLMLVQCFAQTSAVPDSADSAAQGGTRPDGGTTSRGVDAGRGDTGGTPDAGPLSKNVATTCALQDHVNVGSYVVETDYWNSVACPGTQCVNINDVTGAFTVTQGPNCGSTVSSYPNLLYGTSFGETSPGSVLPKQVSALTRAVSSWSFSTGGAATDMFDVAYDIWFCPDDTCGASGFNGGTELMIWLNYPNTSNGPTTLSANLDGYSWQLSTFAAGGTGNSWTYLAYQIQPPMLTSVTNLNLRAFFQDAQSKGYIKGSWYLYAVQAGIELRTGGIPFSSNSFSVSVN
jgi:hypothetical protein